MSSGGHETQGSDSATRRSREAEVYDAYSERLLRIVGSRVHTTPENVEDACHFAWAQYLSRVETIHSQGTLGWLETTAIRQAWKLDGRQRREPSLEAAAEISGELPVPSQLPGPAERAENRERLQQISQLSERQQRLVWLKAAGLSYTEMAAYTGDSVRTVERQILRATTRVRQLQPERAQPERTLSREPITSASPEFTPRPRSLDDRGLER